MIKGTVAIVGRPNVGKSTLFNRLTRSRQAIVDDRPGVTRDRLYGVVKRVNPTDSWDAYMVIDTGGFETDDFNFQPFQTNLVWRQTEQAIQDANLVVLVFDGNEGPAAHDRELIKQLRAMNKPVIFVINKIDGLEQSHRSWEFYELGIDQFFEISAAHNRRIWELSDMIETELSKCENLVRKPSRDGETRIAIIGRPNVGKSSILNRLIGEDRAIVSDVAGTTRDALDIELIYNQKPYVVIDTAGIRRKTRIEDKIESLSVLRSLRGIDQAEMIMLIIGPEGLHDQDARLASLALERHKALMIVVNKWDLVEEKDSNTMEEFRKDIYDQLQDMRHVPIVFVSCLQNKRVHKLLSDVEKIMVDYNKRVQTSLVNECLEVAVRSHTPALIRKYNKRVKFYYATQVRAAPPTIVVKCNVAEEIQESYKRYLKNQFRKTLDYGHAPLRVLYRDKSNKEKRGEAES